MTEFNEGDLVEAVKGESVVRGRVNRGTWDSTRRYQYLGDQGAIQQIFIEGGWDVRVVEKAKVPLPTEPGTVIAIGEWWLVRLRPYTPEVSASWELLPAPKGRPEESMLNAGVKAQCVYGDDWVQAEVDQDRNGFRIISAPVGENA